MGYRTQGSQGAFTSWGSTNFYSALKAAITPAGIVVTVENEDHDITNLGVEAAVMLPGLASWTAQVDALAFATPRMGNVGTVTFGAGTAPVHIDEWEWTIQCGVVDITEFASTPGSGPTWKSFMPLGPSTVNGRLKASATSSAATVLPDVIGTASRTVTLVYGDSATDEQISGTAILKQLGQTVRKGSVNTAEYAFDGAAAWTPAGTAGVFGSTAFGLPLWSQGGAAVGALVASTLSGSRTLSGADSFWSQLSVKCGVGRPVEVSVSVQGVGALTSA